MAANFTISDSESEPSEEVEEGDNTQPPSGRDRKLPQSLTLALPELRMGGRIRLNSESHASTVSRDEELLSRVEEDAGTPTDGGPFRGRSKSAPPELWAATKYGRRLRRMSDEFDKLFDKGEIKKLNAGTSRVMHHSKTWWSALFSHQEIEGENNHHENPTHRTE
ncbi:BCL2 associated agonist of cell death b [Entelurus aequoreus]|uniref:BCL2 associated agonist of cell death b n=1 Tax=Entelurus aequoreus TaxID=161455 RepID=UPI002B1D4404|nr:BCL2 associated agonist of cell death b [Entelurus aequoreus]